LLHSFSVGNDGAFSYAGLTAGAAGNLYGTSIRPIRDTFDREARLVTCERWHFFGNRCTAGDG
jgi:hypothetical protein